MLDIIQQIINKIGFDCQIKTDKGFINIQVSEPGLLIGQNGDNIKALEHLTKLVIFKNKRVIPDFTLDINNYRQQKIDFLKDLARKSAYRAKVLKKEIILRSMPAFDRRLIHTELSEDSGIITESQGIEPNRCVILRPV